MKYLIISDMHGNLENIDKLDSVFAEVDGVLCAGDFAEFNKLESGKPVLDKLVSKHEYIFSVIGNCDEPEFIGEIESQDISVQKGLVFHEGFAISGSGGASIFTNTTPNERTEEDLLNDFQIVENSAESCVDKDGHWSNLILISHNPPKTQKCDSPAEGVHAGSQMLTDFILKYSPLLVVTGHIHEGASIEKLGSSTIINPGSLADKKYGLIEFLKVDGQWQIEKAELKEL